MMNLLRSLFTPPAPAPARELAEVAYYVASAGPDDVAIVYPTARLRVILSRAEARRLAGDLADLAGRPERKGAR